jgi:hypothetical protein
MASHSDTSGHAASAAQLELAFRAMIFVAIAVAGVALATATGAWWTTALALAGVAFAVAGILLTVAQIVDGEAHAGAARGRARAIVLGLAATAALVLAVTLPEHAAARTAPATVARAQATVRGFLVAAVLEHDAYLACQYLTPAERRRVARHAGRRTDCQQVFVAAAPTFAGVRSVTQLRALRLRAVVRGERAEVVAPRPGLTPVTFVLRRATIAQLNAFQAPQVPWRIDRGALALLGGTQEPA